jgi:hypothetical protein
MFCPQCEAEYRTGFTVCKDCQVALVDHLPKHPEMSAEERNADADYVVVATVNGPLEDSQIVSFLEANGIPAEARTETRRTYSFGVEATRILVPRKFVITARDLLERAERGDLKIDE